MYSAILACSFNAQPSIEIDGRRTSCVIALGLTGYRSSRLAASHNGSPSFAPGRWSRNPTGSRDLEVLEPPETGDVPGDDNRRVPRRWNPEQGHEATRLDDIGCDEPVIVAAHANRESAGADDPFNY